MLKTVASTKNLNEAIGYVPSTTLEDGIEKFITWCKEPDVIVRIKNWI
jgi:nucleoside-diphosphate-sugar epimerase